MIGQTIAHYKIIEHLGSGGMGEVYLAVDSKLDRKVALKFLPAQMTSQSDARARFLQEARAASALNHPNVCTIYDIQEHDGQMFIVMEYVEGQTLRSHKNPFTLKQVVEIGVQVADGLAAAHEKGIVHRDIKTENIMIRKDGIVQIMDFGLAKLHGASRLTKEGSTVGTVGYSSPEQIQGQDTDHRTDLFSLGVVLYELISGELPFKGVHETAIMYEIVNVDPQPLAAIKPDFDPELDRIILDCLQKDPDERCQSAKEVARDLRRFKVSSGRSRTSRVSTIRPSYASGSAVSGVPSSVATPPPVSSPRRVKIRSLVPWVLAVVVSAALVYSLLLGSSGQSMNSGRVRFTIPPPQGQSLNTLTPNNVVLSPDGTRLALVVADSSGEHNLWIRPLGSLLAARLEGTTGASFPFWSPDSRFVGYFAGGKLRKIDVAGGVPTTICDALDGRGGTWNREGTIVFAPDQFGGLSRVAAGGGTARAITTLDTLQGHTTHRWPFFLPDGEHYLYYARYSAAGDAERDVIYIGSLSDSTPRVLMHHLGNVIYARSHLLFVRSGALYAQRFDSGKLTLSGDPFPLDDGVAHSGNYNSDVITASENGSVAWLKGASAGNSRLVWFDRTGRALDSVGDPARMFHCELSPDGQRAAVHMLEEKGNTDIWIYDLKRRLRTRFSFDEADERFPVWSPDGTKIIYVLWRLQNSELYIKNTDGSGQPQLIHEGRGRYRPTAWSADGRYVLCRRQGGDTTTTATAGGFDDVVAVPIAAGQSAEGEPIPVVATSFDEDGGDLSPDGRWVTYSSSESGSYEVYVRRFMSTGGQWQISARGGGFVRWSHDGSEIFFCNPAGMLTAVKVTARGESIEIGTEESLGTIVSPVGISPYDVSADGQRFIVIMPVGSPETADISVILNWDAELESK
jgi:serine/threonine protein kinase